MPVSTEGTQRVSRHRSIRLTIAIAIAVAVAGVGFIANPAPAAAASPIKVVVVVGPTGSATAKYISKGKALAAQARSYGASVIEVYSPNATWARVKSAAQGANLLIYLGHGNGHPSPYGAFSNKSKNGMGLNPSIGNTKHKYYGEYYIDTQINLAPNAVVILNHLCYASGNSEPGRGTPTQKVAIQRVDNYGAGFLRANARAVFAEGHNSPAYILHGLFRTNLTMGQIFWTSPGRDMRYFVTFSSSRTKGFRGILDPLGKGRYYRSIIGNWALTAAQWRG